MGIVQDYLCLLHENRNLLRKISRRDRLIYVSQTFFFDSQTSEREYLILSFKKLGNLFEYAWFWNKHFTVCFIHTGIQNFGSTKYLVKSAFEPSGSSRPSLNWFLYYTLYEAFTNTPTTTIDGLLVHRRFTPSIIKFPCHHFYTCVL